MNIGEKIRKGRIKKGLTQRQLSQLIGMSPSLVSGWENSTRIPTGEELIKLAEQLDIVSEFFPGYVKIYSPDEHREVKKKITEVEKILMEVKQRVGM